MPGLAFQPLPSPPSSNTSSASDLTSVTRSGWLRYCQVLRVRFSIAQDKRDPYIPDDTQYHHAIFVVTQENGGGDQHHVIGDISSPRGMEYVTMFRNPVQEELSYASEELLGYVALSSIRQLDKLFASCATPPQQKAYNAARNNTEPFKTSYPVSFYSEQDPENFEFPRLRKCKWWVEEQAIPALLGSQLLISKPPA